MSWFKQDEKAIEISLYQSAVNYKHDKIQISDASWWLDIVGGLFISAMIANKVFEFNEGRSEGAGWLALGGTIALFSILTKNNKKPSWIFRQVAKAFIVIYVLFEILAIGGSYLASASGKSLDQVRENKQDSRVNIERLQARIDVINSSDDLSGNNKAYKTGLLDDQIKAEKSSSNRIINNNEDKLFDELNAYFGISYSEALYDAILASLLVLAGVIVVGQRNGYWCNQSLEFYVFGAKRTAQLMHSCKAWKPDEIKEKIKEKKPTSLNNKGTGAQKENQENTIEESFNIASEWLKTLTMGKQISAKKMRAIIKQKTRNEVDDVIKLLKKRDVIETVTIGNAPNYYHFGHLPTTKSKPKKEESGLKIVG